MCHVARKFRELKNTHPFVNDLCQRRGFLGSIAYAFRGDDYRAERYKAIIDQLKQGSYNAQDNNKKISYFGTASSLKKSVCEKVEEIKNGYLAKTYTSTGDEIYKNDKIVFEELKNFNENVGFKLSKAISTDIQTKDDNDMFIWNEFVKANPEYSSLSPNNQDNVELNIEGTSVQDLKQEVLKKLNLPGNTKLFTEDGNLNEPVGNAIKQQQQQAATKIQKMFNRHVVMSITQASDVLRAKLEKISVPVNNAKELKKGDIIVVAPAKYGFNKDNWSKHGFIAEIKDVDLKVKVNQLHGIVLPSLTSKSFSNYTVFSEILSVEFFVNENNEKVGMSGPFGYVKSNEEHEIAKIQYLCDKGVVFKLDTVFQFSNVTESFKTAAENLNHKAYSRQNNCNHIIYDTFFKGNK